MEQQQIEVCTQCWQRCKPFLVEAGKGIQEMNIGRINKVGYFVGIPIEDCSTRRWQEAQHPVVLGEVEE